MHGWRSGWARGSWTSLSRQPLLAAGAVAALALLGAAATADGSPVDGASAAARASAPEPLAGRRIYMAMIDRFANGDRRNDRGGLTGSREMTGFDPADPGFFHGGDLAGLTRRLTYIRRLGFDAVWITPPVGQRTVQGTSAGYHGYWGVDFTDVDRHFGTRADLRRLVDRAHALGLRVFLDVVVNHTGDVISYRGGEAGAPYVEQATRPYRSAGGETFDPAVVAGSEDFPELAPDRRTFPYLPVVAAADRDVKRPAWLNDLRNYHNRGDSTFQGESVTFGDFYGLDDLFTERPEVVRGQVELWSSWIRDFRLDGFRLDTLRHVDPDFWRTFLPAISRAARVEGVREFATFGEVYDQSATAAAVRRLGVRSVLDFSFQATVVPFAAGVGTASDLAGLFDQDDLYTTGASSAHELVTFLGNHDMGRVGHTLLQAAGGDRAAALRRSLLAHELLLLLRGAPAVYYGDEVGMTGSGDGRDKAARQSMFPTQVQAWRTEPRLGTGPAGAGSSFRPGAAIARRIRALSLLLATQPGLRTGPQITRFAGEGRAEGVFAVSRIDTAARRELVVAFGNAESPRRVRVPTSSPGMRFDVLFPGGGGSAVAGRDGRLPVDVPALGSTVLAARDPLPEPPPPAVTLRQPALDRLSGLYALRADVPGADPAAVTFLFRSEGTRGWVPLGRDDAPPFRLFVEPGRFVRGRPITVVAVARNSAGETATSSERTLTRP